MAQTTLKEILPKFIDSLKAQGRSPSTILAYRADVEQLIDFLQNKQKVLPAQITSTDIEIFRDNLLTQKYTPKSVSRKLNAIKTFFGWAISEKYANTNPAEGVVHPKFEVSPPKFLSPIEYRALRDVVRNDIRIATIVELILQTGMRISEVSNLKLEDIDLEGNKIVIKAYASQPQRVVPLNNPAKLALKAYLDSRPKTDIPFVFVSKYGKPLAIRNIRSAIDRYMQKAEIPQYSINDLRTTFIVENLKAGVDLILLSQIVGHKRLSTTERYLELAGVKQSGKRQELAEL